MSKNEKYDDYSLLFTGQAKCKQFSDDDIEREMIEGLQNLACHSGHIPTIEEIDNHPALPSAKSYIKRFGSLKIAFQMAGIL